MRNKIYLFLCIFLVLGVYAIGNVSAAEGCCLKTNAGEYFKFVEESYCETAADYFKEGITCEDVGSFLDDSGKNLFEKGCCIDYNNFECSNYVYRAMCGDEGLNFQSSSSETCSQVNLNPNPCNLGCCVVNGVGYYETDMECSARTNLIGNEKDFRDLSENKCLLLAHSGDMGACVNSGICRYGTRENCYTGEFYFNKYCSDPELKSLGVSCIEKDHQGCSNEFGQRDVYWKDSCNNQESIAVQCSDLVTKCGTYSNGTYGCINTNCMYNGEVMKNGESECIYKSLAGNGTSFVGSVHSKVTCYEGKLDYKNCGDFEEGRTAICEELTTTDTGFTRAICIPNLVENCFSVNQKYFEKINSEELTYESGMNKLEKECNDTGNCFVKKAEINNRPPLTSTTSSIDPYASLGNDFKYEMCVPKDPITMEGGNENTSCSIATSTCTVSFMKNTWGRYGCIHNCACLNEEAFIKMNNLCISMGDCGLNINIQGTFGKEGLSYEPYGNKRLGAKFSDNAIDSYDAITGQERLNFADIVIPGAESLIKDELSKKYNLFESKGQNPLKLEFTTQVMEELLGEEYNLLTPEEREQKIIEFYESQGKSLEELTLLNQEEWSFEDPIWGVENPLDEWYGYVFQPAAALWSGLIGSGDVSSMDVNYNCLDWQAPTGGSNCEQCSEGDVPCTEYECHSLGQACIIVNKDTNNPECVSSQDDGTAPKIQTIKSLKEGTYSITPVISGRNWSLSAVGTGAKCIPEKSKIEFELNLDEIAQCKYSLSPYLNYNDMPGNYPLSNGYLAKHTFNIDAGKVLEHVNNETYQRYIACIEANGTENYCITEAGISQADLGLRIRCQDIFGHFSTEASVNYCIKTGPDQQAPQVRSFYPENKKQWEYNPGNFSLRVSLDEQSRCRYDYDSKLNYQDFLYNMTQNGKSPTGWVLSANMTNSRQGNNQIYIACNDSSGNINKNILYEYTLKRDISLTEYIKNYGLKMDSIFIEADGTNYVDRSNITTGKNPVLTLNVQTSRGINNGVSRCYLDNIQNTLMKNTDSSQHSQVYSGFSQGVKQLYVECTDGLSKVNASIRFKLTIDTLPPEMISNTMEGDYLTMITNEEAVCGYKNEDADFTIEEGDSFEEDGYTLEHTAEWNPSKTYYIRCVDKYGNENFVGEIGKAGIQKGPIITRMNYIGEELIIKTDRKSTCYYSTQKCDFDINGQYSIQMDSSLTQEHPLMMNSAETYFIKCEDQYGMINPTCTAVQTFT